MKEAERKLSDALLDALADGLMFDDICKVVADTLNNYSKEQKDGSKKRKQ